MRKGREPKINTSTANCFYYCWCSTIEKSTKRADLQRLPHVRAKSLNMLAFRMHTICYARLITKTEAYLTGTALIKQLLLVSGISAVYVMAHTEKKYTTPKETPTSHHHVSFFSLTATHRRNYSAAVDKFKFTLFTKPQKFMCLLSNSHLCL